MNICTRNMQKSVVCRALLVDIFFLLFECAGDQLPNFQNGDVFDIQEGIPINGFDVFDAALKVTENIAYFLPKNTNTDQVNFSFIIQSVIFVQLHRKKSSVFPFCNTQTGSTSSSLLSYIKAYFLTKMSRNVAISFLSQNPTMRAPFKFYRPQQS